MRIKLILLACSALLLSMTVDKPAYRLYNVNGKRTSYSKLLKDALECEVILFGEIHNNPIAHWLQLQLAKDIFRVKKQNLIIGAEMFETDQQAIIDKYFKGEMAEDTFRKQMRLWNNYGTDYKPLLEFARGVNVQFVATNIPRRYASAVFKQGFDALSGLDIEEKKFIAPLPIDYDPELETYKKMLEMEHGGQKGVSPNLPKAQAVKDATMAYFIQKNLSKDKIFLHINGTYHSEYFEGIAWYLLKKNPFLRILTIACIELNDISEFPKDKILLADYIIALPDDMTKTYE